MSIEPLGDGWFQCCLGRFKVLEDGSVELYAEDGYGDVWWDYVVYYDSVEDLLEYFEDLT